MRMVLGNEILPKSYITAVHADEILDNAHIFSHLREATQDLDVIFAASAKRRKNFSSFSLDEAVEKIMGLPQTAQIGLVFGNERTGLTSQDLHHSNFRFTIPQAGRQPSYNLASAVLLTLFRISINGRINPSEASKEKLISRKEQEDCICLILQKLEKVKFLHSTNRRHVTEMMYDLLGRMCMTEKDRLLLLALFSKGVGSEVLSIESKDKAKERRHGK